MKKVLLVLLVISLMEGLAGPMTRKSNAKPLDVFKSALPEEIGDWVKASEDQWFDPVTIFDYIDGEGEVYRAYNMKWCLSRRYSSPRGDSIVVDIFDMGSAADAFGVFTQDQDGVTWNVGQGALYRSGWLSFWKDRFFVSITGEEDTARVREAIGRLAERIASQIPKEGHRPGLISRLPLKGLDPRSIRYLHDHVLLNSHFYLSDENILFLGPDTDAVLAGYKRDTKSGKVLIVQYTDKSKAAKALEGLRRAYLPEAAGQEAVRLEDGKWAASAQNGALVTIVLEADSPGLVHELLSEIEQTP